MVACDKRADGPSPVVGYPPQNAPQQAHNLEYMGAFEFLK